MAKTCYYIRRAGNNCAIESRSRSEFDQGHVTKNQPITVLVLLIGSLGIKQFSLLYYECLTKSEDSGTNTQNWTTQSPITCHKGNYTWKHKINFSHAKTLNVTTRAKDLFCSVSQALLVNCSFSPSSNIGRYTVASPKVIIGLLLNNLSRDLRLI